MRDPPRPTRRGWTALVHDAVDATTDLVAEGHASAARGAMRITDRLPGVAGPARIVDRIRHVSTSGVLGTVRAVNRTVEALVGAGLDRSSPAAHVGPVALRSDAVRSVAWLEDAALGLVNGVVGDRLGAHSRSLDLGMVLRHADGYLPDPPHRRTDRPRLVVLVHGLATTEWSWSLAAEGYHGDAASSFGTLLSRDLGLEPVYARYNTGRPVPTNGEALADRLAALAEAWDPERIVLVGHSMGGLVVRSACDAARGAGHTWPDHLTDVVSLGTPHQGAPLAGLAEAVATGLASVDLPATRVLAGILEARSRGIRDLRAGTVQAGDTPDQPLLPHVRYTFLSATATGLPLFGDLLVPVVSASGPRGLSGVAVATRTFGGVLHHQIQCHPAVYDELRTVLGR